MTTKYRIMQRTPFTNKFEIIPKTVFYTRVKLPSASLLTGKRAGHLPIINYEKENKTMFPNLQTTTSKPRTMPTLNPDGYSIKGCSIIYAPAGQAGEYAMLASNPYSGCGHKCAYCYVPAVLHLKGRAEFDTGATERVNFLARLEADADKYDRLGALDAQVMLSFTTDPYHPGDTTLTRKTIEVLKRHGLAFCTLTKGGKRALRDLDLFRPQFDAFASTLTSLDEATSLKWERGAASPQERMDTLKAFHDAGIFTWVSLEPTLDTATSLQIVTETHTFVDFYKIGRANYLPMTKTTDWKTYTEKMIELCQRLGVKHYIKKDLQPFLPDGYDNLKIVPQHN